MNLIRATRHAVVTDFFSGRQVVVDYESRPLPRRAPRGWRRVWRFIKAAALFLWRIAISLTISIIIIGVMRVCLGVRVW